MKIDLKEFAKEVLNLTRFLGKTNFILKSELEEIIVRHNITLKNLDEVK